MKEKEYKWNASVCKIKENKSGIISTYTEVNQLFVTRKLAQAWINYMKNKDYSSLGVEAVEEE